MAQSFKETAHNNVDQKKFGDNLDRIKKLSKALKYEYRGSTLEKLCRENSVGFQMMFTNEFDQEISDMMGLVYKHIVTEGN